ncbi:unnamed protein product [Chrysodeixis includens]|uniref:Uncharacterized protein n=1 Tax=Chrysodeixis includens TaxID=689277 RepID=A0A9N8Q013_CHRIL|nr:unnamed protein product [Chrysodeixis includens]
MQCLRRWSLCGNVQFITYGPRSRSPWGLTAIECPFSHGGAASVTMTPASYTGHTIVHKRVRKHRSALCSFTLIARNATIYEYPPFLHIGESWGTAWGYVERSLTKKKTPQFILNQSHGIARACSARLDPVDRLKPLELPHLSMTRNTGGSFSSSQLRQALICRARSVE